MKAIFWKDNLFYNGEELDFQPCQQNNIELLKSPRGTNYKKNHFRL